METTLINHLLKTKTSRDYITMDYAIVKAFHHKSQGRQKIWAVATDNKNNIIAEAGNHYKETHPLQQHYALLCGCAYRNTLHAEINLFVKLKRLRKSCDKIFIARSDYLQRPMLAKPCEICGTAIREHMLQHHVKKVYWTLDRKEMPK